MTTEEMRDALVAIGEKAQAASRALAILDANAKVECLNRMADELENSKDAIKKANAVDIDSYLYNLAMENGCGAFIN